MINAELYIKNDSEIEELGDVQGFEWRVSPAMTLWLVMHVPGSGNDIPAVVGIFDTYEAAVAACTTPRHFTGPVRLNVNYTGVQFDGWPGGRYPLAKPSEIVITHEGDITAGSGEFAGIGAA